MKEILVIDDEIQIRRLLEITLQSSGYKVISQATGLQGLETAANHQPDLIILDLGLPDESGHSVLEKLREWYINPILILSVQKNEKDIIRSLDRGANDYLVKPFRTGELLARIRSALRSNTQAENTPLIQFKELQIDLAARTVTINKETVRFTATQYALLILLARNEGKVLTYDYLLKEIWGDAYIGQLEYLRVYIAQLRNKIEKDANHPAYIITEPKVGYRFVSGE